MDSPTGHGSERPAPALLERCSPDLAGPWPSSSGSQDGPTAGELLRVGLEEPRAEPRMQAIPAARQRAGSAQRVGVSEAGPDAAVLAPPAAAREGTRPQNGFISTVVQVGVLALVAYLCLFNFSVVRGSSMAPRIHDGDRILIDHFSYMMNAVERGDIVVLKYPLDPTVDYIKRVIGLPGDRVTLKDGHVFVNGEELEEPYVDDQDVFSDLEVEVLPAHYFVLGDNRRRSCDSREFGQVPAGYVRGKVEMRVWPLDRAGRIDA